MRLKTRAEPENAATSVERPDHEPVMRRDALSLIDDALAQFVGRSLVASTEVVDILLDIRSAIDADASFAALVGNRADAH